MQIMRNSKGQHEGILVVLVVLGYIAASAIEFLTETKNAGRPCTVRCQCALMNR